MKFFLPKEYGFCTGVSTAIHKALSLNAKAYCLGELVHNSHVTEMLAGHGIQTVQSVEDVPDGETVIIRAHGVGPDVYRRAEEKKLKVVDATCPYVRAIQKKAKKYHDEGYTVVLVGDKTHPEIVGINGWCDNTAVVFDGKVLCDLTSAKRRWCCFRQPTIHAILKKA